MVAESYYENKREQWAERDETNSLQERQVKALESIAVSLKALAGCVNSGGAGLEILIINPEDDDLRDEL